MTSVARSCDVPGCGRAHKAHGLCNMHYNRKLAGREINTPLPPTYDPICSHEGCEKPHVAKGYCGTHYVRNKNGRNLNGRPPRPLKCEVRGCVDPVAYRGMCALHNQRRARGGDLNAPRRVKNSHPCVVSTCSEPYHSRDFCARHYKLNSNYKMTPELMAEFDTTTECQICGEVSKLHVDHDHACCPGSRTCGNCTRGFICSPCNTGIGHFRDDEDILRSAIQYLSRDRVN